MNSSDPVVSKLETFAADSDDSPAKNETVNNPDPITGEAGAHPVGVGIGALGAGAAGATLGAIIGPVGAVIGAAIGAVAGGIAGKQVAGIDDPIPVADGEPVAADLERPAVSEPLAFTAPTLAAAVDEGEKPLTTERPFVPASELAATPKTAPHHGGGAGETISEEAIEMMAHDHCLDRPSIKPGEELGEWEASKSQHLPHA
jgi:hypothetical protein